jgi:uncharacterized membrane protein
MQTFISAISNQSFSVNEKISITSIRKCILDEILKDNPLLNQNGFVAISELDIYRQRYIAAVLQSNVGDLTQVEKDVVKHINDNEFISNHLVDESNIKLTYGQALADKVASFGGSWKFIIIFGFFILIWMIINVVFLATKPFDPYPFILLNLILSCLAALQAPVIMMSQNRQEEKDRERAKNDYMVNLKSEVEIRMLHEKIDHLIINQQEKLMEVQQVQIDMLNNILQLSKKKEN